MGGPEHFSCEPVKSDDTKSNLLQAANLIDDSGDLAKKIDSALCEGSGKLNKGKILLPQELADIKFREAQEAQKAKEAKEAQKAQVEPPSFSLISTAAAATEQAEIPLHDLEQRFIDEAMNYTNMWQVIGVPSGQINEWNKRITMLAEKTLALPGKAADLPNDFFIKAFDNVIRATKDGQADSFEDIARNAITRAGSMRVASR